MKKRTVNERTTDERTSAYVRRRFGGCGSVNTSRHAEFGGFVNVMHRPSFGGLPSVARCCSWAAAVVFLPLALGLPGCGFNRESPPVQLLDLGPPRSAVLTSEQVPSSLPSSASAPVSPLTMPRREPVAVSFSAAQMLTDTGVIWRVGDSANLQSYATYRWATPPMQLVQQRVLDRLSAMGPVVQDGVDPRAPLLQVSLTRFEQVYAPDGKSSVGQVSMQAVLVRDRRVVDALTLSRSAPAPAPTQNAQGGVLALRAATDAAAEDLATWLARRLSASGL